MKAVKNIFSYIMVPFITIACSVSSDWRTASRESAGIAPDPAHHQEAVIHVYGADAWGWRGWFAIHTWIAVKRTGEESFTVFDVVGWRQFRGRSVLAATRDIPDRYWFGARPRLLLEKSGQEAESLIDSIEQAVLEYPWKHQYSAFPGPNSNTFVAWVATKVPELNLRLPFSAIGSGYVNRF